jgi:predicted acylesterase/phospholipase RssA
VAVDVADGLPVTFDSYPKADGSRKTEYGRYISQKGNEIGFERVIKYDKGITSDHVMASGSYPVNFDYASLEVENYDPPHTNKGRQKDQAGIEISQNDNVNTYHSYYKKKKRYFWDGGLMSNTPLSQLVLMHRNYWYQIKGVKEKIPSLGICIVNVHPTRQLQIPIDHDGVVNRNNDITFSDRSHRDEEVLLLISDYVDLVRDLIKTGKEAGCKDDVINELMNRQTKYHGYLLKPRKYKEMVEGSFDIADIVRIERKNDENTISDKTFDFSYGTIEKLLQNGYEDTMDTINNLRASNVPQ